MTNIQTHIKHGALLRLLGKRRYAVLFILGMGSGLPLALTTSTLSWWLATQGSSLQAIGLFSMVGLPYALKFLWAPLFDKLKIAFFLQGRRGALLLMQIFLFLTILVMGMQNPKESLLLLAMASLAVAFFSASCDIALDGYRIALLSKEEQGLGGAVLQLGYRLGLLVSGAGALFLSEQMAWHQVYGVMALCLIPAMLATLWGEAEQHKKNTPLSLASWSEPVRALFGHPSFLLLLLFIPLYKLGDAVAGVMLYPFYYEMGFSASELAFVSKLFGTGAVIAGTMAGAVMSYRMPIKKALLFAGILQLLSNFVFVWMALWGHDIIVLFVAVGIENVTGGMGAAVFVAFLSRLCAKEWAGTHYALLSSLAVFGRTALAAGSGFVAQSVSWEVFFMLSALAALPALVLLRFLKI